MNEYRQPSKAEILVIQLLELKEDQNEAQEILTNLSGVASGLARLSPRYKRRGFGADFVEAVELIIRPNKADPFTSKNIGSGFTREFRDFLMQKLNDYDYQIKQIEAQLREMK